LPPLKFQPSYNKPTRRNSGSIVFINNYKYALHISDALCVHHQDGHHGRHGGHEIVQCSPTLTSLQDLFQPNSWQTAVAAVTVYSAPDDGRKEHPKHIQHTCSC